MKKRSSTEPKEIHSEPILPGNLSRSGSGKGKTLHDNLPENEVREILEREITGRKKTEERLRDSEEKYRTIVETASEGILIGDLDGKITFLNDKMAEMLGYTYDEIIGHKGLEFMFREEQEKVLRTRNILKSSDYSGEFKFRRKDGSVLWTSCNASPVLDKKGKHIANLAMHTDVTERKKTEDELFQSNERFRIAFEEGAVAMSLTSLKGEFIRVNRAFCKLTGYSEDDLNGMLFQQMTYPDDLEVNLDGFKKVLTGEKSSFRMEKRYIRQDGEIIWVDISSVPVRDRNGNIDYMVTHIQDINERRTAEDKLHQALMKLDIALETGYIGIWEGNVKNREVTLDERTEKIFGLKSGTYKIYDPVLNALINEEDLPHLLNAVKKSLEGASSFESVFRIRSGNEDYKYVLAKALVTGKKDDIPEIFTGICFDVTAIKHNAEVVNIRLNEELLRSNRELENFAYVASHDLQEPLRMVSSFTQLLEQRYSDKLDQDARDYIKFAVDGSRRMYDLINGMLDYSRVHTKRREFSTVKMSEVLEKVLNNLNLSIGEKNAVITNDPMPVLIADEQQMVQLLQNLIENSLKFSPVNPRVHISSWVEDRNHHFAVRDEGIGIDPQYFERIFRLYQQLMPKDKSTGIGIGLTICKRIVERHGGRIWVDSKPEKGSTFYFTIPYQNA